MNSNTLIMLFMVLFAFVAGQGAGAEWWTANFVQTTGATGNGGNTGVFKYNWPLRRWSISFGATGNWVETYSYNTNRGYPPAPNDGSVQTRHSQGSECNPTCGVAQIPNSMPPLAPSLSSFVASGSGSPCTQYTPTASPDLQFISSFTASGSGASTVICSITLTDGRTFVLNASTFSWGNVSIPIPTGCVCDNQMDVWILVDHSSSISDTKMANFKAFVQTFLANLAISPNGVNVGMSWYHFKTGINFNITGNLANINAAMTQWWTNCTNPATVTYCRDNPSIAGCQGCQAPATATSTAIRGYKGSTTSPNWVSSNGLMDVVGAASSFYDPTYGGSVRQVPKMFLTLTDGAVNHFLNQNGGVGACNFSFCSPDLIAAVANLRATHNAAFPGQTLTTLAMGIGTPGSDPNLSLSPEHLAILAEGKAENWFTNPSFDLLQNSIQNLLLLSCPAANDVVQNKCLETCCGLCVCGTCKPPSQCSDTNKCTNQVLGSCCNTVPENITISCPTSDKCNLSTCDAAGAVGGLCRYSQVDCSGFTNGCIRYNCSKVNGQCTTPDYGLCPPIDCTYGEWSQWTSCSASCGNGTINRGRSINQTAWNGGAACSGPTSQSLVCNLGCCAVNCAVSNWISWTPACPTACGTGTQNRTRTITTSPVCGGTACPSLNESRSCPACVNTNCVGANNTGTCNCTSRRRTITYTYRVQPSGNGTLCPHPDKTVFVNAAPCTSSQNNSCPVDCVETWSAWTPCDCNYLVQNRTHTVLVVPKNKGKACNFSTNFTTISRCTPDPAQNCPLYGPLCNTTADCIDSYPCTLDQCILKPDGLTHCDWLTNVTCAPNKCYSSHICDSVKGCLPVLKSASSACPTPNACNKSVCDAKANGGAGGCNFSIVDCSAVVSGCQKTQCNNSTGACTVPDRSACPPVNCSWNPWGAWSSCIVTCGGSTITRRRSVNQTALDGGLACNGSATESTPCNTQCCPVNCAVSNFGPWSTCTLCTAVNITRSRTITRNASCSGTPCPELVETTPCPCVDTNCSGTNSSGPCSCEDAGFNGTKLITFTVTTQAAGNGLPCDTADGTTYNVSCSQVQIDACPRPCIEQWTTWTTCNCYLYTQSRDYQMLQNASNGGTACSQTNNFTESQSCTPTTPCTFLGPPCEFAADCNDEIACTNDACVLSALDGGYHCEWVGAPNCTSTNICESGYCDNTIGCRRTNLSTAIACPTSNPCNLSSCDNSANGGTGGCVYTPKDCSQFTDGCQAYLCSNVTGQCSIPDRSACPPINCTYGEWTAWTVCPVTCGNGTQTRTRSINQTAADGGAECTDPDSDRQTCDAGCCPVDCVLNEWTQWSSAACTFCGTENQTRTRDIAVNVSCGGAVCDFQEDFVVCVPCAPVDCVGGNTTEPCNCTADGFSGTHVVIYVITQDKVGTGASCPHPDHTNWTEPCTPSEITGCPKPCIEQWSSWSVCDCFNTTQRRNYEILQYPTNGGIPCQYSENFTTTTGCTPDPSQNCPTLNPTCVTALNCNDGRACTVDKCLFNVLSGSYHCDWSETLVCNDSSVCTSDVCDEINGCVYSPVLFCNDNNACTQDTCDNVTGCQYSATVCPDHDICNLAACNPTLGCILVQRNCSLNVTNNCTATYCDVNYTQKHLTNPCVAVNRCASSPYLIGIGAGIVAAIIICGLIALAVCSGTSYAVATNVRSPEAAPVLANPLYQGNGKEGHNALFEDHNLKGSH